MTFSVDPYLRKQFCETRYNCWDMLREAILELLAVDIGDRTPDPPTVLAMRRRFDREEAQFERIPEPVSPCIVLLRRARTTPHVGLFWRGRVLHIQPGGARYERLCDARRGFTDVGFYKCSA